ncbi:VOC family protein [Actinoplanes sp. NPDC048791]|uniref:VOC family protein n=1 Tax=Actinoplanes sp. NPDC048791 TaxID=3154623 RepID=UPI0033DB982E
MNNGIGWFEIGTDRPAEVERFYGEVLGWTFGDDDDSTAADGAPYRIITTPAAESIRGGLYATGGKVPNYAVFTVLVADTAATCRQAEAAGGKVLVEPVTEPGGLTFAHLLDPSGNHFGIFTPPASHDS